MKNIKLSSVLVVGSMFVVGCATQPATTRETTTQATTSNANHLSAPAKKSNVSVEVATTTVPDKAEYQVKEVKVEVDAGGTYVTGVVTNDSENNKTGVGIKVPVYDMQGNKIGDASDYISNLKSKGTWKFKARYFAQDKNVTYKADEIVVTGYNE